MKKHVTCLALALLFLIFVLRVNGQIEITEFKAKVLYNASRLVDWPENYKNQDFIIGIYGNNELSSYLESLVENRKAGTSNIVVRNIKSVDEIGKVHILYIAAPRSGKKDFQGILNNLNGKSTLIVTEREGLTNEGAAINFVIRNDILKFELKESNATRYRLKINSRLKELAIVIT